MYLIRKNGATSNVIRRVLRNSSTGQGLTGLTHSSSGLIISTICDNEASATAYTAAGSTIETITTLGTYAAPTATKCRFKEVDSTNHPGLYEIQLADARFSVASAKTLRITISGASSLLQQEIVVQLTAVDVDDTVRLGLTALPNVATGNAGALLVAGTGTAALSVSGGVAQADAAKVGGQTASASGTVTFPAATLASTTNITSATGVDITKILGTAISTPATAGVLDVNAKAVNNVSTSGVTTVSAYVGNTGAAINGSTVNTNLDATITSRMASYTQPTGFLAATFPTTVASTTNITSATGVDVTAINGSTAAAARLALSAGVIIPATVDTVTNSHTPTTTEFDCDDITEATNDHYVGRVVIFTSGALIGQATSITDYTQVGGIGRFTVVAMTEAPANNDTLIII